ncbi:YafY family protein [Candidatus Chloroploca sp. Khr17]|uniref:helix-turn-helix transcriptional regulator n=1 Tax=Candidatus Chloroploca sp. Khr17 TaxID=2496869 RepID=UPI00101BC334|nr:WYL domain-containing protein [Candidatus Chloroploca sp. Khr17]
MSVRLERMLAMDTAIRSGAYPNVASFMQRFEVSERTIRADIAFFQERFNAPLKYDRSRRGYYYTDPAWQLPTMMMSEGELMAFFLSVELVHRYLGTAFERPLRNAVDRLAESLPVELRVSLNDLTQHYTFQPGATSTVDPELLLALFEAMQERWPVKVLYLTASTGERRERIIEPYHLFNVRGNWQVVAFDHHRTQMRQFSVSRIEAWNVCKSERFTRDPTFSPAEYLNTSFLAERGDRAEPIEIWFDAYQSNYMRGRTWHPTQQIEEHNDGSMTLRFQSGALAEIRRWVMSFGRHAIAKAPASLVDDLRRECAATLAQYT